MEARRGEETVQVLGRLDAKIDALRVKLLRFHNSRPHNDTGESSNALIAELDATLRGGQKARFIQSAYAATIANRKDMLNPEPLELKKAMALSNDLKSQIERHTAQLSKTEKGSPEEKELKSKLAELGRERVELLIHINDDLFPAATAREKAVRQSDIRVGKNQIKYTDIENASQNSPLIATEVLSKNSLRVIDRKLFIGGEIRNFGTALGAASQKKTVLHLEVPGHRMMVFSDPENGTYRFFDPNLGIFKFSSAEEMTRLTSAYIERHYNNSTEKLSSDKWDATEFEKYLEVRVAQSHVPRARALDEGVCFGLVAHVTKWIYEHPTFTGKLDSQMLGIDEFIGSSPSGNNYASPASQKNRPGIVMAFSEVVPIPAKSSS